MTSLYLGSTGEIIEFLDAARAAGRLGLDTEFHRERRFYPELALVQLAVDGHEALLDPLAGVDLTPLDEIMADARVVKILHAPQQDLEIFYWRSGRTARNLFDTQTAAAMLGMGAQISLGGLVERLLDVRLSKGESFTDWLVRPLSAKQEQYALGDVRHLLAMHDVLVERLSALNRLDWLTEELRKFEDAALFDPPAEGMYRKVKRYRSLDSRGLAVLRELTVWREQQARARDRNRRAVVADEVLVEVARSRPRNPKALGRTRGLHAEEHRRSNEAILAAIERGLAVPDDECPRLSASRPVGEASELCVPIVQAFLKLACGEAGIDSSLIATASEVERLVSDHWAGTLDPSERRMLQGWRGTLVGARVMAFLRGEIAVRMDPATAGPVFEEVAPQ